MGVSILRRSETLSKKVARTDEDKAAFLVGNAPASDVKQGSPIRGFFVALPVALMAWAAIIAVIVVNR
jgi:hypothetical protein